MRPLIFLTALSATVVVIITATSALYSNSDSSRYRVARASSITQYNERVTSSVASIHIEDTANEIKVAADEAPTAPKFVSHPSGYSIAEPNFVTLTAEVSGTSPIEYQWFKDSKPIPDANDSELHLYVAGPEDAAAYRLEATNGAGDARSRTARIHWLSEPAAFGLQTAGQNPIADNIVSIAYGNGQYIALGEEGTIAQSTDRKNWRIHRLPNERKLVDITFGDGQFVVVGDEVFVSNYGCEWEKKPEIGRFRDIDFWNGKFIAAADTSIHVAGKDLEWKSYQTNSTVTAVGHDGKTFLAVTAASTVYQSEDGETWDRFQAPPFTPNEIAYGNGIYVIVGSWGISKQPYIIYSSDAKSWQAVDVPEAQWPFTDVVHNGEQFIAVGDYGKIAVSSNGKDWLFTNPTRIGQNVLSTVLATPDTNLIIGNGGLIMESEDPFSWPLESVSRPLPFGRVAHFNGQYFASSAHPSFDLDGIHFHSLFRSDDGINWAAIPFQSAEPIHEFVSNENTLFALGKNGSIYYTTDGSIWETAASVREVEWITGVSWNGTLYAFGKHPAENTGVLYTYSNDESFEQISSFPSSKYGIDSVSNENGIVVVAIDDSNEGTVFFSKDGIKWTDTHNVGHYNSRLFLAANEARFILGLHYATWYSDNGTSWTYSHFENGGDLGPIAYGSGFFLRPDNTKRWAASEDGTSWAYLDSPAPVRVLDLLHDGSQFISVGLQNSPSLNSTSGLEWGSRHAPPSQEDFVALSGNSERIVALGEKGAVAIKKENSSWRAAYLPYAEYALDIAFGADRFIASARARNLDGYLYYSETGEAWEVTEILPTEPFNAVEFLNNEFITVGGGKIGRSRKGSKWTFETVEALKDVNIHGIAYGNGNYVAVGSIWENSNDIKRIILVSDDALAWRVVHTSSTRETDGFNDIVFGNNRFVAITRSQNHAISENGERWQFLEPLSISPFNSTAFTSITHDGEEFTALFDGVKRVARSPDGRNWRFTEIPSNGIAKLASVNGDVFGLGEAGSVFREMPEDYFSKPEVRDFNVLSFTDAQFIPIDVFRTGLERPLQRRASVDVIYVNNPGRAFLRNNETECDFSDDYLSYEPDYSFPKIDTDRITYSVISESDVRSDQANIEVVPLYPLFPRSHIDLQLSKPYDIVLIDPGLSELNSIAEASLLQGSGNLSVINGLLQYKSSHIGETSNTDSIEIRAAFATPEPIPALNEGLDQMRVRITFSDTFQAADDFVSFEFGEPIVIPILDNDRFPDDVRIWRVEIVTPSMYGTQFVDQNPDASLSVISYNQVDSRQLEDRLTYRITDEHDRVTEATVYLRSNPSADYRSWTADVFGDPQSPDASPFADPHNSGYPNAKRFAFGLGDSSTEISPEILPKAYVKGGEFIFEADLANDPRFVYSLERLSPDGEWVPISLSDESIEVIREDAIYRPYPLTPTQFIFNKPKKDRLLVRISVEFGRWRGFY